MPCWGASLPSEVDETPETFTFTAGTGEGEEGTITFRSVSNRGIGEKTVTYKVHSGWTLDLDGRLQQTLAGFTYDLKLKADDIEVIPATDGALIGTGTVAISGPVHDSTGFCSGTYETTERVTLGGTNDTENSNVILQLKFPPGTGSVHLQCGPQMVDVPIGNGGGFGQRWGTTVGEITFDSAGESVQVDKQGSVGGFPTHATGTVTLTPK